MMKRLVFLTWLLAAFINSDLLSQSKEEIRNNFYEAESWILFEAYQDALPLYQQLLKIYPDNSNYKYRIGQCYINIPGEKAKAIRYLEDAAKNINPNYKEGKFNETKAPSDALYYLANAYLINNQIDSALNTYKHFKEILDIKVYDTTIVNLQIQACLNARQLMKMPVFLKSVNLGNIINETNNDYNPVVSDKEDLIVFSRSQAFYDALLYSTKTNGIWSNPINMNELLKVDRDLFPTSLSKDGKDLYLYSSADYDGNIYTSRFESGTWSPVVKLNENINTKYWESHATVSHDNKSLYFTSNRKGTYGGLDIYISNRDSTGDWGLARNLGPVINSPYNEETPFLSEDDKTLFFSSRGHLSMGGYDIFYSKLLKNGEWAAPMNIGYPLNTTDDDLFFKPLKQGYEGYIAKELPGGYGKQDIYKIEIFSNNHPRKFFLKGKVRVADLNTNIRDSVKITAMNIENPAQTIVTYSNPETGEYEFQLPQGNYEITYQGEGGASAVKKMELPLLNPSDNFIIPELILPKTDLTAVLIVKTSKNITVTNGDSILFPLEVEPNSSLRIERWAGNSLLKVESFSITGSTFNYKMAPRPGRNKIVFALTDKYNNKASSEVIVTWEKPVAEQKVIRPENSNVISQKQIAAISALLISRAGDNLLNVIKDANTGDRQFANADEYISFLKDEALKKGINPDEVDKLALKVALMDNILTQAAVDYLAKHTDGQLKGILEGLNISESNLKSWTDLQQYVKEKSGGKITPEDLDRIAADILAGTDPSIVTLRRKVLMFSEISPEGELIRQSVKTIDQQYIKTRGKWLQGFYDEAVKHGLTQSQLSEMLVLISSLPDTKVEQYLKDLIEYSEEPFASELKKIDEKRERIKTPEDLLGWLITNKEKYPQDAVFKSIANLIIAKDISAETIKLPVKVTWKDNLWILWILLAAGLLTLFLILWKRRKNNKSEKKE
jgi:hypothetical protein